MGEAELTALADRLEHIHADGLINEEYADLLAAARVVRAMATVESAKPDGYLWSCHKGWSPAEFRVDWMSATYFTPKELADVLRLSESKVREVFAGKPGVITLTSKRVGRRQYRTMRIPWSAVKAFESQ